MAVPPSSKGFWRNGRVALARTSKRLPSAIAARYQVHGDAG